MLQLYLIAVYLYTSLLFRKMQTKVYITRIHANNDHRGTQCAERYEARFFLYKLTRKSVRHQVVRISSISGYLFYHGYISRKRDLLVLPLELYLEYSRPFPVFSSRTQDFPKADRRRKKRRAVRLHAKTYFRPRQA